MKKLIQTSIVLLLFSTSLLLFQMSCKKEASAQTGNSQNTGLIVFQKDTAANFIFVAKYDGSNRRAIKIQMPANVSVDTYHMKISPDGSKLIFNGYQNNVGSIYTCNIDGTNVIKVITEPEIGVVAVN